jgi:hypothetical protein
MYSIYLPHGRKTTPTPGRACSTQRVTAGILDGPNAIGTRHLNEERSTPMANMITKLALIATTTAAATLAVVGTATAHADNNYQTFASPAGHIRCILSSADSPSPIAMCQIGDHSYVAPPGTDQNGGPCPSGSDQGRDFRLDQGRSAYLTCTYSALGSGFGPWPTLDYGQTRSLGAITCDSEPSGMRCTDSSTGHFFRVAQQSYELG